MNIVRKFIRFLETLATITFFCLVILIALQITYRYFGASIPWTEELSRVSLIWSIYLGVIIATFSRDHIRVEIIDQYLTTKAKQIYNIIVDFLILIFSGIWTIGSWKAFVTNQNISLVTMNLSTGISFYLPTLICSILIFSILISRITYEIFLYVKGEH